MRRLIYNIFKLHIITINHPLNVNNKFASLLRSLSFNLKKIFRKKIIFPWVEESKLIFDNTDIDTLSQRQIKISKKNMEDKLNLIFIKDFEKIKSDCISSKNFKIYPVNLEI